MNDEQLARLYAVRAMRQLGVIRTNEVPSEEDLAVAVTVIGNALLFENALAALERYYNGAGG